MQANVKNADVVQKRYFLDPDGNRLEIYYEMSGALRGDKNFELAVSCAGEPLPDWLSERWPSS